MLYFNTETNVLSKGIVAAHTLPVLYERYEDEVDNFVLKVFGQMQNNYRKLDAGVLKGKLKVKKHN
jgi:hypothetical protein